MTYMPLLSSTLVEQGTGLGKPPLESPILSPSSRTVTPSVTQLVQLAVDIITELTNTLNNAGIVFLITYLSPCRA